MRAVDLPFASTSRASKAGSPASTSRPSSAKRARSGASVSSASVRRSGAHDVHGRSLAEHERERAEQHRFARTRLARAHGEAGGKVERRARDQPEILDLEAREPHALSGL
jgi:hypothetical protein